MLGIAFALAIVIRGHSESHSEIIPSQGDQKKAPPLHYKTTMLIPYALRTKNSKPEKLKILAFRV